MLAQIEAELAGAGPAEMRLLHQRAELIRGLLTANSQPPSPPIRGLSRIGGPGPSLRQFLTTASAGSGRVA